MGEEVAVVGAVVDGRLDCQRSQLRLGGRGRGDATLLIWVSVEQVWLLGGICGCDLTGAGTGTADTVAHAESRLAMRTEVFMVAVLRIFGSVSGTQEDQDIEVGEEGDV